MIPLKHWFHHACVWVMAVVCYPQRQGWSPSLHSKLTVKSSKPDVQGEPHCKGPSLSHLKSYLCGFWSKLTSRAALKADREREYFIKKQHVASGREERFLAWSWDCSSGTQSLSHSCCSCFPGPKSNNSPCTYWSATLATKLGSVVQKDSLSVLLII